MTSVVIFGSGFVGAPLSRELKKLHPEWRLTIYTRSTKSDAEIKADLNVDRVVRGDFSEFEKIKQLTSEHDIAVNTGSSFTPEPAKAIVAGFKGRPASKKGKAVHISGSGNFIDFGETGAFNEKSKVWNDDNEEDIKQIHEGMFNGPSDTVFLQAGDQGIIENYLVCFPVTYGGVAANAPGAGVGYNLVTQNAKSVGYVPYVGDGSAVLSTLHLLDGLDFLVKIIEKAASGPAEGSAYSRYYILETARLPWKDIASELAKVFYSKGIFDSPNAKSVDMDHAGAGEVKHLVAANMLVKGDRAKKMGFKPTHPTILEAMHEDLKDVSL